VRAGVANGGESRARPRPQHPVVGDQRPVEIEGEGGDAPREVRGKVYGTVPPVEVTTYAETSAICCVVSVPSLP
jgi:hypothetical protein